MDLKSISRRVAALAARKQAEESRPQVVVYLPDNHRGPVLGPQEHVLPNGSRVVIYKRTV